MDSTSSLQQNVNLELYWQGSRILPGNCLISHVNIEMKNFSGIALIGTDISDTEEQRLKFRISKEDALLEKDSIACSIPLLKSMKISAQLFPLYENEKYSLIRNLDGDTKKVFIINSPDFIPSGTYKINIFNLCHVFIATIEKVSNEKNSKQIATTPSLKPSLEGLKATVIEMALKKAALKKGLKDVEFSREKAESDHSFFRDYSRDNKRVDETAQAIKDLDKSVIGLKEELKSIKKQLEDARTSLKKGLESNGKKVKREELNALEKELSEKKSQLGLQSKENPFVSTMNIIAEISTFRF